VSKSQTRRTFLKLSAAGLTATATAELTSALTSSSASAPTGEIKVRVTSGKLRYASTESLTWRGAAATAENAIVLDPTKKYQEMLGFGAAFTDAACYMFNQLPAPARDELFHELFHPSEMGLNVCRTCIGSSDYSTEVFSYDEGEPDPDMKRFSIVHDEAYVLPMLRLARKANPELFLFSSPWSPPGWMKAGGSMLGGSIRQRYFGAYAQYFVKFLQAYAAKGVPIQAVTVQNEVTRIRMAECPPACFRRNTKSDSSGAILARCCRRMDSRQKSGFSTITIIYGAGRSANSTMRDCASIATRSRFMDMWARLK
jgi:glucosylceramidase